MRFPSSKPCLVLVSLLLLLGGGPRLAMAQENVVLLWDKAVLQAVRNLRTGPPIAARAFAITHTCIYDAWAAYDPVAVGTRLHGTLRRPVEEHTPANKQQAISFAAYRALIRPLPDTAGILRRTNGQPWIRSRQYYHRHFNSRRRWQYGSRRRARLSARRRLQPTRRFESERLLRLHPL